MSNDKVSGISKINNFYSALKSGDTSLIKKKFTDEIGNLLNGSANVPQAPVKNAYDGTQVHGAFSS